MARADHVTGVPGEVIATVFIGGARMKAEIAMKNHTLKNIPEATYARLKESAEKNGRSLNSEILMLLERFAPRRKEEIADEIRSMAAFHRKIARKGPAPPMEEIAADVREGRR